MSFGLPITAETLKEMPRYFQREITQVDCAREAMRLIHAEGKNLDAEDYAWKLQEQHGRKKESTMVLVYNATGDSVRLAGTKDWRGGAASPIPYTTHNGQWTVFIHVGSKAGRVFRGRDVDGRIRDFAVVWRIPKSKIKANNAYTEIGSQDYFNNRWDTVETSMKNARRVTRSTTDPKCASTVTMGGTRTAILIAVLQHKFDPLPDPYDEERV